jgi:hypothetical protein
MKYTSRLFAVLLMAGSLAVPALYADGGGITVSPRLWKTTPPRWLMVAVTAVVSRWRNGRMRSGWLMVVTSADNLPRKHTTSCWCKAETGVLALTDDLRVWGLSTRSAVSRCAERCANMATTSWGIVAFETAGEVRNTHDSGAGCACQPRLTGESHERRCPDSRAGRTAAADGP